MTEPLDITYLEKTWDDYVNDDTYTNIGKLNLAAWMGENVGLLLQEIRILRTQVFVLKGSLEDERAAARDARWRRE